MNRVRLFRAHVVAIAVTVGFHVGSLVERKLPSPRARVYVMGVAFLIQIALLASVTVLLLRRRKTKTRDGEEP